MGIWVNPQNGKVGWELEKGESGYLGEGRAKESRLTSPEILAKPDSRNRSVKEGEDTLASYIITRGM